MTTFMTTTMVLSFAFGLVSCGAEREPVAEAVDPSSQGESDEDQDAEESVDEDVVEYLSLLGRSTDVPPPGSRKRAKKAYSRSKKAGTNSADQLGRVLAWGRLSGVGFKTLLGFYGQLASGLQRKGKTLPMRARADMASAAAAAGRYATAAALCNLVNSDKKSDRKSQSACYGILGAISALKGNLPRAAAFYRKSIDLDSTLVGSRLNLAFLCLQAGLLSEADAHLRRISTDHWLVLYGRAESARAQGKYKQAVKIGQRVVKKAPEFSPAFFSLGMSMLAVSRTDKARQYLSRYLKKSQDEAGRELARKYLKIAEQTKAK